MFGNSPTRRDFLRSLAAVAGAMVLAACAPIRGNARVEEGDLPESDHIAADGAGASGDARTSPTPERTAHDAASSPTVEQQATTESASGQTPAPPVGSSPTLSETIWRPNAPGHVGRKPLGKASVRIDSVGDFVIDLEEVSTRRPDIFRSGHFSMFDVLAHLAAKGEIEMEHHLDSGMDTHIIDAVNGQAGWWYEAYYAGGWRERNVFRMDMFPFKNGTNLRLVREGSERLERIYRTFRDEVVRLEQNGGRLIVPELVIQSPVGTLTFRDVQVTPHNVRSDLLQPGVITALDVLASLADQGKVSRLGATWYEQIGFAEPVDHYFVEEVNAARARGGCGFVYEVGPEEFRGFDGTHIHLPSDARVIVSPEYEYWFWICL